ncbi:MAG: hypothetical protein Q7S42_05625, partial [Candidatus Omnitrophota bacterium]|nr:hypothetical protein [Candidatus Omnitrophota bacterium]
FVFFRAVPEAEHNLLIPILSSIIAACSIFWAWVIYQKQLVFAPALVQRFAGIYRVLKNKYYIDEFYAFCVNRILFTVSNAAAWFDRHIVDGAVNGTAWMLGSAAARLRKIQTGLVQNYALGIFGGVVLLCLLLFAVK